MPNRVPFGVLFVCLVSVAPAFSQFGEGGGGKGPKLGEAAVQRWKVGVTIVAEGGPCTGLVGYVPLFVDWPEQQVSVVEEDVSQGVKTTYELVEGTKVMLVKVPFLAAGAEAKAIMTFETRRCPILVPTDTTGYSLPNAKKLPKEIRPYLAISPGIEARSPKIKTLAKKIADEKETAWQKVEALYDWVRENIPYEKGPHRNKEVGAMAALQDRKGTTADLTALFIALCRSLDIPARTVWIPGHCYPEFYLVDDDGRGHWFPCEMKESRSFGGIPERRPVLMKGDNFRPPYDARDRQRMLREHIEGAGGTPRTRFIRQSAGE